jgi:hypothetical protein
MRIESLSRLDHRTAKVYPRWSPGKSARMERPAGAPDETLILGLTLAMFR